MKSESMSRRSFLGGAGVLAAGMAAAGMAGCAPQASSNLSETGEATAQAAESAPEGVPSWLGQAPEIDEAEIVSELTTDLVIAGAGNGGMAAAAYAADKGLDFMVFEAAGDVSGTRNWFAAIDTKYYAEIGQTVDRGRLMGEIARYSAGSADERLIKMVIDESNDMCEFVDSVLAQYGGNMVVQDFEIPGGMGGTPYYTPPFEHMCGTTSEDGLDRNHAFEAFINDKGHEVYYEHRLIKLTQDDAGRVTGAILETPEGYVRVTANKGVMLATGGYVNNAEMLEALSPITCQSIVMTTSEPKDDGMGQKAAMWAGATRDAVSATMIFDRGWVDPGTPAGWLDVADDGTPIWPSNIQINCASQPWLKVNVHGERFMNESACYDHISHYTAQQPNGTYFCIWDANFAEDVNRFGMLGCAGLTKLMLGGYKQDDGTYDLDGFFQLPIQGDGNVLKADTLEELADLMLLDDEAKKTFLATVERYNELYDNQEDVDFFKEAYRLSEIRKPPYYAASVGGRLLTTIDGIRINADCQALNEAYEPIEGLYCVGDCSGSVFAGCYPDQLHGFACGRTMTEALHVVKNLA